MNNSLNLETLMHMYHSEQKCLRLTFVGLADWMMSIR